MDKQLQENINQEEQLATPPLDDSRNKPLQSNKTLLARIAAVLGVLVAVGAGVYYFKITRDFCGIRTEQECEQIEYNQEQKGTLPKVEQEESVTEEMEVENKFIDLVLDGVITSTRSPKVPGEIIAFEFRSDDGRNLILNIEKSYFVDMEGNEIAYNKIHVGDSVRVTTQQNDIFLSSNFLKPSKIEIIQSPDTL